MIKKIEVKGKSWYSSLSHPDKFILIPLIVTAGKSCVTLSCPLYRLSAVMTLPARTDTSRFKGISFVNIVALFSGDMWTKLTKLRFVHSVHPCPCLSDSEEGREIYSLPEMTEDGTVQNWSRPPINCALCSCSSQYNTVVFHDVACLWWWWWWWCSQRKKSPAMKAQTAGGADCICNNALFCLLVCRSKRKSFHLEGDGGRRWGFLKVIVCSTAKNIIGVLRVKIGTGVCRSSGPCLREGQLQR